MSSERRPAPLWMPERLFAGLATGGGSAEAIAFLERGERARRLLLLRTMLDRLEGMSTPLASAAEAWRTVKEAASRAPEPVERLLLAPATGRWIAHVLRRLHSGSATGPPLWAEAGRLCAVAAAAAVHAGTETDLRVPLTDGRLHLPGLGLVCLPDAPPGTAVGRAVTRGGRLILTGPGRGGRPVTVTCRPRAVRITGAVNPGSAREPHWVPLRTLTHTGPDKTVAIALDDLDPYRDLDVPLPPARLDADEAEAWQRLFQEAAGLLAGAASGEPGRLDPSHIRAVVPWGRTSSQPPAPPTVWMSASSGDSFGAMVISRPGTALALAETLVHEFQHSKLGALLHLFPLLDDDREERYYAPWRPDPRHLTGLLHGAYAFTAVAGFWRDRMAEPDHADRAAYHFALRRLQSRLVVRTLLSSGRLTAPGRRLVTGLARTLDAWLREPVAPDALARARTAAALHRTEWRLRNVAPGPGDAPRLRPDREHWPDRRTQAFAVRPTAPRTADEHLAAADPATALTHYADALTTHPADPHLLAGWIVAHATKNPGPTTRRLLARPELLQPQPSS
ncbi:HEXXH motif domain-containing protein [Streptomyces sp. JB150]|uniref:HEXXH motif domain-containing protein n=1 Tax=Streptomyces sp. JB150 TaxID=2714844 RepID=UPI00140D880B|nr:HEXXH motif domain-containing protein [Streptomyces sp. JB150]QIJ65241.1 radical SAM protein [Streptomyces sp. JB150]